MLCSFSKRLHSIRAVSMKAFSKFVIKKKKKLSPFKTVLFNRNLPLHNSRASPLHNKRSSLGLFLILHLRCVLGEMLTSQVLGPSTWPARLEDTPYPGMLHHHPPPHPVPWTVRSRSEVQPSLLPSLCSAR